MKNGKKYLIAITIPILVLVYLIVISFHPTENHMFTIVASLFDTQSPVDAIPPSESISPYPSETLQPEFTPEPSLSPAPEPDFEEYDITLLAVGDNLMHMGIVRTGRMEDGTYDYTFLFENIRGYLDAADIKIINQETILGGNELGFSGFPLFNSPTEVGDAIADAGF